LPFTLSHPAAVVPLRRILVLSALVVGSMAPDFHYFLNLAPHWHFTHTVKGAFLFCLPVGLGVLWIFHAVMKLPLISLTSERYQSRLVLFATPFQWKPAARFAVIVFSILVGIGSHIVWDAFTHERGLFVRNVPDLRTAALEEFGSHRPLYSFLQHGSTLLGMALLIFWYWRWFKRTSPQPVPTYLKLNAVTRRWTVALAIVIACGASLAYGYVISDHLATLSVFAGASAVALMSLVLVEALLFSLGWHWIVWKKRQLT
jgi:uncharacterized protein DUF4184